VLVAVLDGTAVVAVEGAIAAMHSQPDLFGGMVIAFIVGLGGGGVALVAVACRLGVSPVAAALLAGAVCLALRLLSVHYGWQLPKVIA
jgi:uncharacterized membrane protein YeiH